MVQYNECKKCNTVTTWKKRCPKCWNKFIENNIYSYKKDLDYVKGYDIQIVKINYWRNAKVMFRTGSIYSVANSGENKRMKVNLLVPEVRELKDLFAVLHEEGHIVCNHGRWGKTKGKRRQITAEVEVWQYALRCVKEEHKQVCIDFALHCIKSYFPRRYYNVENFEIIKEYLHTGKKVDRVIKLVKQTY